MDPNRPCNAGIAFEKAYQLWLRQIAEVAQRDDPNRPYPEGIAFDEDWRQRQRADAMEASRDALRNAIGGFKAALQKEIDNRQETSDDSMLDNYNRNVVYGMNLAFAIFKDAIERAMTNQKD